MTTFKVICINLFTALSGFMIATLLFVGYQLLPTAKQEANDMINTAKMEVHQELENRVEDFAKTYNLEINTIENS